MDDLTKKATILKFELDTVKGYLFDNSFERWVPGCAPHRLHIHHKQRYELAYSYTKDKRVLDIACGSGYGSYLLAEYGGAESVLGVDLDKEAVEYGNLKYPHKRVERKIEDAQEIRLDSKFDVIISFETVEHLPKYKVFLQRLQDHLKPDGVLLISTPIVKQTTQECVNPFHVIEWSFEDYQNLISSFFTIKKTYLQNLGISRSANLVTLFIKKVQRRFFKKELQEVQFPTLIEWEQQVSYKDIASGYQIAVCTLKKE